MCVTSAALDSQPLSSGQPSLPLAFSCLPLLPLLFLSPFFESLPIYLIYLAHFSLHIFFLPSTLSYHIPSFYFLFKSFFRSTYHFVFNFQFVFLPFIPSSFFPIHFLPPVISKLHLAPYFLAPQLLDENELTHGNVLWFYGNELPALPAEGVIFSW